MARAYRPVRGGVTIWSMVAILCLLLSFSAYIVTTRIRDLLPGEKNIISITYQEPSMEVGAQGEDPWTIGSEIGLFKTGYQNGTGEIVVESARGDNLIAPGVTNYYRFFVKNNGNVALDFSLRILPSFYVSGMEEEEIPLPISVRLSDQDGNYLIGGRHEWVSVSTLKEMAAEGGAYTSDRHTVGVESYYAYIIEWKWEFESGNDSFDTMLGSSAVETDLLFSLEIATSTVESDDPYAEGGKRDGDVSGLDWEIEQFSKGAFILLAVCAAGAFIMDIFHLCGLDDYFSRRKWR